MDKVIPKNFKADYAKIGNHVHAFSAFYCANGIAPKYIRWKYVLNGILTVLGVVVSVVLFFWGYIYYMFNDAKPVAQDSFPAEVEKYLWGTHQVNTSQIKELTPLGEPAVFALYTDNQSLYYFSNQKQRFYHRADITDLQPYQDNLFSNGEKLFFTELVWLKGYKVKGSSRLYNTGYQMTIFQTDIAIQAFEQIYTDENISFYKYQNRHFLTIKKPDDSNELFAPCFFEVQNLQAVQQAIQDKTTSELDKTHLKPIANTEEVLAIKEDF